MTDHDQIPEQALAWLESGQNVALATVVQTWGSAPRPVGSQLAINQNMDMAGSVSGGCVESAVIEEALEAMADGVPRILEYGVSDENAFAAGLACGGEIHVLVEPVGTGQGPDISLIKDLVSLRRDRKAAAVLTNIKTWARQLVQATKPNDLEGRFASDKSGFEADWFVKIYNPPLRMMIIGAAHIAHPLSKIAQISGYDVVIIDPREAFASPARFLGQTLIHDWPDAALAALDLDQRVAVVTLSHDPKIDDPAIETALRSGIFYLGCLGSSRTHAKRKQRLLDRGFESHEIARIHAPVGADIGAKSPAEIAISIMAEITERLRRPKTRR